MRVCVVVSYADADLNAGPDPARRRDASALRVVARSTYAKLASIVQIRDDNDGVNDRPRLSQNNRGQLCTQISNRGSWDS